MVAMSVFLSACGGDNAIDAPPHDVEQEMLRAVEGNPSGVSGGTSLSNEQESPSNLTVYLKDHHGYLAPVSYNIEAADPAALAKAGLDLLVEGSVSASQVPQGFSATLPKGTSVQNVTINPEQKVAVVEFSKQFQQYEPEQERRILESITWTLTSIADVEQVQLWMDSQKLTEMPVNGTPLDSNLTRNYGINLEKQDNVSYLNSMPVLVYFTSLTTDGKTYYVPVTRLIEPTDDVAQAALQQLIAGPQNMKAMSRVMTEETKINKLDIEGDTMIVDLGDSMFDEESMIPVDLLKSVVLSLTELPDVEKVKISINGRTDIKGMDSKDYSEPVSRPVVNQALKG